VIEIMTFRLRAGADEAAFLEADRRVQTEFAYRQPGLLRRTTARSDDRQWIVIDLWQSDNVVDAAGERSDVDPTTTEFMALVQGESVRIQRYATLD
jgi:hypothetical protein